MTGKRTAGVSKARRMGVGMPTVVAVAAVVLLAVVVIGGVLLSGGEDDRSAAGPIPVTPSAATYPTTVANGVVIAGRPAPSTLEVWEDALCPACQAFEQRAGERIARAVSEGRLQVRYHMVNLLDRASSPQGYSSAAGNALICAAENGAFPTVHTSLYAAQPSEGGAGYTTEQLVGLGQAAGAGPGYAACVTEGRHTAEVAENYRQATENEQLLRDGSFGTPTLLLDGRLVEVGGPELAAVLQP